MSKTTTATLGSFLSSSERTAMHVAVSRTEMAQRRRALEEQARKSRRNLSNPQSFKLVADRVAG